MGAGGLIGTAGVDQRPSGLRLYGGLFAGSVAAFCLAQAMGRLSGPISDVVAIAGDATCGWSWLLVRGLFQPRRPRPAAWPLALVLILVAIGAALRLSEGAAAPLPRVLGNVAELVSSALLLLALIEPLKGLGPHLDEGERRFRLLFAASYAALLAVAVIWVDGAPATELADPWRRAIKPVCAVLALAGMGGAIWWRLAHPLPAAAAARRRVPTADATGLAQAIRRLMEQDGFYARQNLKVADVARRLGEPDYKVTQCVTGALGFRNFNQMANHLRIEEAKRRLSDPACDDLPILTIAYDCGFGSIGPFNRTFKAETGQTPRQFRQAALASRPAGPGREPARVSLGV